MRRLELLQNYPNACNSLEDMRALQFDWDTYGARPVDSGSIELAYKVLWNLKEAANTIGLKLPELFVVPIPDGGVHFEWNVSKKEFELEIAKVGDKEVYTYLLCPSNILDSWEEGEFITDPSNHRSFKTFLSWL